MSDYVILPKKAHLQNSFHAVHSAAAHPGFLADTNMTLRVTRARARRRSSAKSSTLREKSLRTLRTGGSRVLRVEGPNGHRVGEDADKARIGNVDPAERIERYIFISSDRYLVPG